MSVPPGWGQPPHSHYPAQPPQQPFGYPGYLPPGFPQPPMPRKSKAPMIILIIALVLVLAGLGTVGFFYFRVNQDYGQPAGNIGAAPLCDGLNKEILAKARTTNLIKNAPQEGADGSKFDRCEWVQLADEGGSGFRALTVFFSDYSASSATSQGAKTQFEASKSALAAAREDANPEQLADVGDDAYLLVDHGDPNTEPQEISITIEAYNADRHVLVTYRGFDVSFFSKEQPAQAELKSIASEVAKNALQAKQ